jgi:hypothetical protein
LRHSFLSSTYTAGILLPVTCIMRKIVSLSPYQVLITQHAQVHTACSAWTTTWNTETREKNCCTSVGNDISVPLPTALYRRIRTYVCTATNRCSQTQQFIVIKLCALCPSQWPRGLRRGFAAARLLGVWVRIPPGSSMFVTCDWCELWGRGFCVVPRNPTECGVSECDR